MALHRCFALLLGTLPLLALGACTPSAERAEAQSGRSEASAGQEPERPERWSNPPVGERLELSASQWRERLSPEEYRVLREQGTERSFTGDLHDHHGEGTFRCAGCGAPLFDSRHKFDSGTGWPSFDRALPGRVAREVDNSLWMTRTEVHCARCDGHLGHLFPDGPRDTTGMRYCINSVSLDFDASAPETGESAPPRRSPEAN
ncbi:MAG: peptide-methionine (R)-S-oxide reductase MsrB [Myxococcota bacterium]